MSRELSIALLSHLASPVSPTGAERSADLLARGLVRRGHRVALIAPGAGPLDTALRDAGVEVVHQASRMCWMAYYEPRPWPVAAAKWARFRLPDPGAAALARLLSARRPDVVHVNALPHVHGAAAASRATLPVAWHVREILPPGARRRWFATRLRRYARRIVAVSRAVGGWLEEEGLGDRVSVVPNGAEIEVAAGDPQEARRNLHLPCDGTVIGLFGQIRPHKGALEFVQAGRQALGDEPSLRFLLAGHGPADFLAQVRRTIDAGEDRDRFHLLPPQASPDLLLAAADVVCLATRTPDPLPRAVLEAMACGLPVAAFRSGGTPEMVEDGRTGILVETGDIAALARAMARLGADAALRARMGAAGRERARDHLSVDAHLDRMEALFREAAG